MTPLDFKRLLFDCEKSRKTVLTLYVSPILFAEFLTLQDFAPYISFSNSHETNYYFIFGQRLERLDRLMGKQISILTDADVLHLAKEVKL